MWQGGVTFGEAWMGYVGEADHNTAHAHIATQLTIGLGCKVTAMSPERSVSATGVMISPRVEHVSLVPRGGRVAILYVSPHSELGRALDARFGGRGIAPVAADLLACFSRSNDFHAAVTAMEALCRRSGCEATRAFDSRLMLALDSLRHDSGSVGSMSRASAASGLSDARLRSLSQAQLSVPLSQWMIWRKLERTARAIAAGCCLADAAAVGGFADQAHLARTMRRMFGITPSEAVPLLRKASDSFKTGPAHATMMTPA